MTPDEWLATFESKVAEVAQKAATFTETLAASAVTETSPDGSLRVSVAPNGALTDLSIEDSAMRRPGADLAQEILTLTRKAQRAAATHVTEALAPAAAIPRPTPAPRRRRAAEDEDYSDDRIFGDED